MYDANQKAPDATVTTGGYTRGYYSSLQQGELIQLFQEMQLCWQVQIKEAHLCLQLKLKNLLQKDGWDL